jgi:hypothetical protein
MSMRPLPRIGPPAKAALLLLVSLVFAGCNWLNPKPKITFTKVPPASVGGPDKLATIEGRVTHVKSGQQVVLYAATDELWWVQPFTNRPFIKIDTHSSWSSQTHLGRRYAALVVDPGYRPPETTKVLPEPGGGVAAVAIVKGEGPEPPAPPTKALHFSGYDWKVRSASSSRGGVTLFDLANAWTDANDSLHLRIAASGSDWTCAEVNLSRSLGYGSYRFVVRDSSHLEPAAVLSMFTYDDSGEDQNHRELDVELSRWGNPLNQNAEYVVQPYYLPQNAYRFTAPRGVLTYSFRWDPGRATFRAVRGASDDQHSGVVAGHVFTSGVPTPGGESVHVSFYFVANGPSTLQNPSEVVIEKFEYLP